MLECRMDENGVLYISATTPVERYALGKWVEENVNGEEPGVMRTRNIVLNWGKEPEVLSGISKPLGLP